MEMTINGTHRRIAPKDGILEFPTTKGVDDLLETK